MRLAVVGASGKMGRAVVRLAIDQKMSIAHAIGSTDVGVDAGTLAGIGALGVKVSDDLKSIANVDVVVDFSSPSIVPAIADACVQARAALISGTTGLDDRVKESLARAAKSIAVMWEPNWSVGVSVLAQLVTRAAEMLPNADIEIVETHHRMKVDAPSGTALRLAESAQKARKGSKLVTGREGKPGARTKEEVGVLALRGGDVIGDHTVHLLLDGERIELTHRATNRDLFARGALRAASWIAGKPAGTYTLADVLA